MVDDQADHNLVKAARLIAEAAAFDPHHLSSAEIGLMVRSVRELADRLDECAEAVPHAQAQGECPLCMVVRWLMSGSGRAAPLQPEAEHA